MGHKKKLKRRAKEYELRFELQNEQIKSLLRLINTASEDTTSTFLRGYHHLGKLLLDQVTRRMPNPDALRDIDLTMDARIRLAEALNIITEEQSTILRHVDCLRGKLAGGTSFEITRDVVNELTQLINHHKPKYAGFLDLPKEAPNELYGAFTALSEWITVTSRPNYRLLLDQLDKNRAARHQ